MHRGGAAIFTAVKAHFDTSLISCLDLSFNLPEDQLGKIEGNFISSKDGTKGLLAVLLHP